MEQPNQKWCVAQKKKIEKDKKSREKEEPKIENEETYEPALIYVIEKL